MQSRNSPTNRVPLRHFVTVTGSILLQASLLRRPGHVPGLMVKRTAVPVGRVCGVCIADASYRRAFSCLHGDAATLTIAAGMLVL